MEYTREQEAILSKLDRILEGSNSGNHFKVIDTATETAIKQAIRNLKEIGYPLPLIKEALYRRGITSFDFQEREEEELKKRCITYLALKERSKATELIVQYILKNNYIYTIKNDEKPEVWIYTNGIYTPQGESTIKEITREVLGETFTNHLANEIISKIQADTFIESQKFFNNNYLNEIPVRNGILDIFTREIKPFTPNKIFFSKCPVIYDPKATYGIIDNFLSDILAKPEDRKVFYEIGGFGLLKDYTYEKAFMFIGNGRNGKGKSIELIKRVYGAENCYALPLAALQHDNADVSQLFGKLLNAAGDIGYTDLKDTSMFKSLTGRDIITTKRKFLTALTFVNYAKFLFACNELPKVYDMSKGFWERWVLLEFPYEFKDREVYEAASPEERKNWKIKDEDILEKIATETQLSGLLNAFLDGLDRLRANHKFSSTQGSEEVKDLWIRKADSFMAFCMDFITEDVTGLISKKELRNKFCKYCKTHKLRGASDNYIKRTLESNYGVNEVRKEVEYGNWEYFWEGIKWKC